MVPPVVLVGIGQLAGCNGAIRSAVPFRCLASRTFSERPAPLRLVEYQRRHFRDWPDFAVNFFSSLKTSIAKELLVSTIEVYGERKK